MHRFNWLFLLLLLVGCAERVVVHAPVLYPAQLPVRVFPSLIIAGGVLPEGDLGERLKTHLEADKQHDVRRVEVKELEPMRQAGGITPWTLVVLLEAGYSDESDNDWQVQPVQYCDIFYGCYTDYAASYGGEPRLLGEVAVTVYEGPSARKLQSASIDAWLFERDTPLARKQVFEQLALKLARAVDVLQSEARAELERVDDMPIVGLAIERIGHGQWTEGRDLLEQAARQLGGQRRRTRARVWYDLAIARQYAPGPQGLSEDAYRGVEQAFHEAIQNDGSTRYVRARERAKQARERQRVLDEQRRTARDNYALKANNAPP